MQKYNHPPVLLSTPLEALLNCTWGNFPFYFVVFFRFDLIFILLDVIDIEGDKKIAEHVIRMHRFRSEFEHDGEPMKLGNDKNDSTFQDLFQTKSRVGTSDVIFEGYDEILHGDNCGEHRVFTLPFFIKYIQVARALKPSLTITACDMISIEYSRLRTQDLSNVEVAKTQPVTARTLESLIRISTAHAKSRISKYIETIDVKIAISLINYAYFKEMPLRDSRPQLNIPERSTSTFNKEFNEELDMNKEQLMSNIHEELSEKTFCQIKEEIFLSFTQSHAENMQLSELYSSISHVLSYDTFLNSLNKMQEMNEVMVSGDSVYLI